MEISKFNNWLSLISNVGVLIGVFFVIIELRQSNSIANRETASELLNAGSELNFRVIENPEFAILRSKLRATEINLSPMEEEQAFSWALTQINFWTMVNSSYENELISENMYETQLLAAARTMRRYPGLFKFMTEFMTEIGSETGPSIMPINFITQLQELLQ